MNEVITKTWLSLAEVMGADLPWLVADDRGRPVAQFKKRMDAELFMHARPHILFGAPLPLDLADYLNDY